MKTKKSQTTEDRFWKYHSENPQVYRALVALAMDMYRRGIKRWSIAAAVEMVRWGSLRTSGKPWKISNSYRAYYARLIMEMYPELEGMFMTKSQPGRARDDMRIQIIMDKASDQQMRLSKKQQDEELQRIFSF